MSACGCWEPRCTHMGTPKQTSDTFWHRLGGNLYSRERLWTILGNVVAKVRAMHLPVFPQHGLGLGNQVRSENSSSASRRTA